MFLLWSHWFIYAQKHFALNANSQLVPETHNFGGPEYKDIRTFLYIAAVVVATHSCMVEFENLKFHEEVAEVYQNSK